MAHWDNRDVDAEATKIARAYLADRGGDLTSLAVKVARDHGLNQEQVRRLCRAANVKTFEAKFAESEKEADRVPEYDPVDAEAVIHALYKDAAPRTKAASATYPRLVDEMDVHRPTAKLPSPREKTAEQRWTEIERALGKDPPADRQLMRLQKVAEELRIQELASSQTWKHAMEGVLDATRGLYWDHDDFEKDALAIHGGDVLPELNAIRDEKRLDRLEIPTAKLAELRDHLLGRETEHVVRLKCAADARVLNVRCTTALADVRAKMAALRQVVTRE